MKKGTCSITLASRPLPLARCFQQPALAATLEISDVSPAPYAAAPQHGRHNFGLAAAGVTNGGCMPALHCSCDGRSE